MENKRKNIYIVIFVITTIVAACIAVYFKINGDKKISEAEAKSGENNAQTTQYASDTSSNENSVNVVEKIVKEYNYYPELDSSKCINSQGNSKFQLRKSCEVVPLSCLVNSDNKTAVLTTDWNYVNKVWGFVPNGGNGPYEQKQVNNFSGEIVDVINVGWGQTVDHATLLFLMKDGTVEYIPVYNAYKTNKFNSYGKINGVSDIVYIGNATVDGYATPIAMKADGSFYNLSDILKNTGNYNF